MVLAPRIRRTRSCSSCTRIVLDRRRSIVTTTTAFLLLSLLYFWNNVSAAAFHSQRPCSSSSCFFFCQSSPGQSSSQKHRRAGAAAAALWATSTTTTTTTPPEQQSSTSSPAATSTTSTTTNPEAETSFPNNKDRHLPPVPSPQQQQPQKQHWAQPLLDWALQSPLWQHVLVPAARQKIITTARANGILWSEWLFTQSGPWQQQHDTNENYTNTNIPEWYRKAPYHAYATGHLNWEAALEMELASAAVGARNMPQAGVRGEAVFRHQFRDALSRAGATVVPQLQSGGGGAQILDIGCATGTSTRWLAREWLDDSSSPATTTTTTTLKEANAHHQVVGLDLSPYLIAVATRLAELAPLRERRTSTDDTTGTSTSSGEWVCDIPVDPRISYRQGNGACTPFANNTFDVVNLQFVAHELPIAVTLDILREAHRLLKPQTGQFWFCEMDFQSPAYAAQRQNPFLFALIRATEPYLDEYADGQAQIWQCLQETFASTVIVPATGRHFAAVATKGGGSCSTSVGTWTDRRFDEAGNYKVQDTHLQVWENKATTSLTDSPA